MTNEESDRDDGYICEDCGNELELEPGKENEKVYACRYCFGCLIATQRKLVGGVRTKSPFEEQNKIFELPTFNGYTVDLRLKQFRKVAGHESIEFIEFDSVQGKVLLFDMRLHLIELYEGFE